MYYLTYITRRKTIDRRLETNFRFRELSMFPFLDFFRPNAAKLALARSVILPDNLN